MKELEIPLVSRRHCHCVHSSRGGYHRILQKVLRFSEHQASALAKTGRVHRNNLLGQNHVIHPGLDFLGFSRILLAGEFNPYL